MKTFNANCLLLVSLLLILASCVIPESNHVRPTYHLLSELGAEGNESLPPGEVSFYVSQVELPTYLQDSRLVSRPSEGLIEFRENDRWGEPLEEGIARVLGLNLGRRLNTFSYSVYPHRKKVSCMYDLGITVQRFERIDSESILLEAICEIHFSKKVNQVRFVKKIELASAGNGEKSANQDVRALSQAIDEFCGFLALRISSSAAGDPDD
jgi:uncharacterized lipoprotein YmbA